MNVSAMLNPEETHLLVEYDVEAAESLQACLRWLDTYGPEKGFHDALTNGQRTLVASFIEEMMFWFEQLEDGELPFGA